MFKKISFLIVFLMVFSLIGFATDYRYTQESGVGFFVTSPDKADAIEDTCEIRQIVNDLGTLLAHSKMDGLYPKDLTTGGTLAIPNSALVSFATGTKGDLFYCSATNVWTKLNIGTDNQILVVATDLPNWETPSSDLLSDVASIAMLDENEAITGAWTVTGSIGGIDTTEFGYLATISAFGATIIDDADEATFKATVNLEIGTDVLAYQAIGIADDNLVEIDDADAAVDDYCKLTTNGIVGRSYSEVKTDLGIDLSLYYLKTEINTLAKVETIYTKDIIDSDELATLKFTDLDDTPATYDNGKYAKSTVDGVVWDTPAGGYTNLTSFVDQTAWRVFYSNTDGDVVELALGTDGQYLKSTGATSAPEFDTPTGAGDMLKTTYDNDEDGDIDVAAGGTEKSVWTLYAIPYLSGTTAFGEITIGTAGQVLKVAAGATSYEFANESDPTVDSDAEIKAILVDEITKTGDFTAGKIAKINNATGIIEQGTNTDTEVADAVTKKHTQNTDTQFDFYNALGSDHTWSGDKDTQLVGESVVFGDLLYFNWTDKEWKKTDADAAATMPGLRIALETKSDGQTCLMLEKGYIRDDSAFEFAAAMVYTSVTPGAMSSTAPTETGDQVQRVGVAKSADILFFDPSIDVGEI